MSVITTVNLMSMCIGPLNPAIHRIRVASVIAFSVVDAGRKYIYLKNSLSRIILPNTNITLAHLVTTSFSKIEDPGILWQISMYPILLLVLLPLTLEIPLCWNDGILQGWLLSHSTSVYSSHPSLQLSNSSALSLFSSHIIQLSQWIIIFHCSRLSI